MGLLLLNSYSSLQSKELHANYTHSDSECGDFASVRHRKTLVQIPSNTLGNSYIHAQHAFPSFGCSNSIFPKFAFFLSIWVHVCCVK